MNHYAVICDTKLLNLSENVPPATKIIDFSSQLQIKPIKIIRNKFGEKLIFQGKLAVQILYEEQTSDATVKVFRTNLPILSAISGMTDQDTPLTSNLEFLSIELLNRQTFGVSFMVVVYPTYEIDKPTTPTTNHDETSESITAVADSLQPSHATNHHASSIVTEPPKTEKVVIEKKHANPINTPESVYLTSELYAIKKRKKLKKTEELPSLPVNTSSQYKPLLNLKETKTTISFKNLSRERK